MEQPVSDQDSSVQELLPPDPSSPSAVDDSGAASVLPNPPVLTVLSGLPPASHILHAGSTVIGRSSEADLQIKHPEISRRHCRLTWDGQIGCTVEDLNSRWGTKINGGALSSDVCVPLQPGDRLQIGPVLVYFGYGPPPSAESAAAESVTPAGEPATSGRGPQVLFQGHEVEIIPLGQTLRLGRAGEVDIVLSDPSISRQHATIERTSIGYQVTDLRSRAGSLVNGRRFEKHQLVIGDQLQMGPFFFRFDGQALERTTGLSGVEIDAKELTRRAGPIAILDHVSVKIERGQFVAILGPSGSGKSSLLDTLTGLRQADSGTIHYDGMDFYQEYERLRSFLGYVPQDDIVHRELTVSEALLFSAQLRLPAGTPDIEIQKLVAQTINRLGLEGRTDTPIHRLSGGQRKRVSVGVELLGRPSVLFLDEPTSGLDPASEFKMMELLRHLADGGCTVICTTHVMENVFLTDKLFVIAGDKATGGKLVFSGGAQEARDHFGVQKLTMLYDRLAERPAAEWREIMHKTQAEALMDGDGSSAPETPRSALRASQLRPPRPAAALPVLLERQWTILCADWKNFLILLGQPLVIALLVAWVTDETALALFFAYLATLWFGCSNAAQEIVKEIPIYRRERMVGLGRHSYLLSKFAMTGTITVLQGLFLFACLWSLSWVLHPHYRDSFDADAPQIMIGRGLYGSPVWQIISVSCTSFAAVGIGFAISAIARSTMQAVMIVPLVLIPQILFCGLVVEPDKMPKSAYAVTYFVPSYAAQTIMDVSVFWHTMFVADIVTGNRKAFDHLKFLKEKELARTLPAGENSEAAIHGQARRELATGKYYDGSGIAWIGAIKLVMWTLIGYAVAWYNLREKERG